MNGFIAKVWLMIMVIAVIVVIAISTGFGIAGKLGRTNFDANIKFEAVISVTPKQSQK